MYQNFGYSWLPLLAADAYLCDNTGNDFLTYGDTLLIWEPDELEYYEEVRGGVNVVDMNLSTNINDRIYLGATIGISTVDYTRCSEYLEYDANGAIYVLENNNFIKGNGFDIKLGAIFRPFKYSPFKVGLSVHTPTWYVLNEYYWAGITDPDGKYFSTIDKDRYGDELNVQSNLTSPWRFNASMSYTFGTYLALDAEYEYVDYASARFTGRSRVGKAQNEEIKCNLKGQHIARLGAELNIEGFAIRTGYNYMTAPFTRGAYKDLYNASAVETSTDYMNRYEKNVVTFGAGYHGKMFYFDMAYMLEMQDSDFAPFYDYEVPNPVAKVQVANHSAVATIGIRF